MGAGDFSGWWLGSFVLLLVLAEERSGELCEKLECGVGVAAKFDHEQREAALQD